MNANNNMQIPFPEWVARVITWAAYGYNNGGRGPPLILGALFGPFIEKYSDTKLEDGFEAIIEACQEKQRQYNQIETNPEQPLPKGSTITNAVEKLSASLPVHSSEASEVNPSQKPNSVNKWLEIIVGPCIVLILGKRGSGKTACAYSIIESLRHRLAPYVFGIPEHAAKLLPNWIKIANNLSEIPPNSIVLIDEAHLFFNARESYKTYNKTLSDILSFCRQNNLIAIFVTQEARQIDKSIISNAEILVFKQQGVMQMKFDRPELTEIAAIAKQALDAVVDKVKWSYVYSPDADFAGLVENSLPTFWSEELSCAFAMIVNTARVKTHHSQTKEQEIAKAKELRNNGNSFRKIAKELNVSVGKAHYLVKD